MHIEAETWHALRERVERENGGRSMLFAHFRAFHRENPHVLDLLIRYSLQLRQRGRKRYGIGAVFERVRWHLDVETTEDTGLKLNNNYRAYYARLLMLVRPELRHIFQTRALGHNREKQILRRA
jgi:hypothetical protein